MRAHGVEGLGEPALHRLVELVPQLRQLAEALLQVLALRRQVGEVLLLALVLLGCERVDPAEILAGGGGAARALEERLTVVALRRLRSRGLQPPLGLCRSAWRREVDIDRARPGRDLRGFTPDLRLGRAQLPQVLRELAGRAVPASALARSVGSKRAAPPPLLRPAPGRSASDQRPVASVVDDTPSVV